MKVYIYYLTVPEEPSETYDQRKIDEFNDLVIETHMEKYDKNRGGAIIEVNGVKRYLYAFTNKKSIANDFEFLHNMTLFTRFVRHMDKDEYEDFRVYMEYGELRYFDSEAVNVKGGLLLTKMEYYILNSSLDEIEIHLSECSCIGYEFLKDEYIRALDILLYTTYNKLNSSEAEFYDYNYGYGLTPEGVPQNQVTLDLNYQRMYLHIFGLILK